MFSATKEFEVLSHRRAEQFRNVVESGLQSQDPELEKLWFSSRANHVVLDQPARILSVLMQAPVVRRMDLSKTWQPAEWKSVSEAATSRTARALAALLDNP